MKIVVLAGGLSPERNVSLSTGTMVTEALRALGHRAGLIDLYFGLETGGADEAFFDAPVSEAYKKISREAPDLDQVRRGRKGDSPSMFGPGVLELCRMADMVFLALHGTCGEDGRVQAAFDLMDCNGKLGIGVICAGVDARVAADVHRYKRLPLVTGPGAYLLSLGVNVLLTDIARPTVVQAGLDRLEEETSIICICNGRYYGGGFMPVGDAQPDDGVLDMVVVPRVSRFTFFRLVGAYAKGRYRSYPEVIRHFHGPAFSFSSPEELVAVIDGEVMRAKSFTVRISERKVAFFYPGDLDYRGEN